MERIAAEMQLAPEQHEFEGRGYVHSSDVVNAGFIQGETSHVAVQVVYDELAILDDYEGVDITRITRELSPANPLGLNLMRITVDGEPIDDPKRSSSDIQRCTDVAMNDVDIQFGFDNRAVRHAIWVGFEFENFRLQHNRLGQIFEPGLFRRRHLDALHFTAHFLGHDLMV